jgi:hypothetical protein
MNQLALDLARSEATALVIQALAPYKGRANGIDVKALAAITGLSPRMVRHAVSDLDFEGSPVCSHPSHGYYIALDDDDVAVCADFLEQRALHGLKRAARLRKLALPALMGQLQLKEEATRG